MAISVYNEPGWHERQSCLSWITNDIRLSRISHLPRLRRSQIVQHQVTCGMWLWVRKFPRGHTQRGGCDVTIASCPGSFSGSAIAKGPRGHTSSQDQEKSRAGKAGLVLGFARVATVPPCASQREARSRGPRTLCFADRGDRQVLSRMGPLAVDRGWLEILRERIVLDGQAGSSPLTRDLCSRKD